MPTAEQSWTQFTIRAHPAVADALGARCIELGAPGVLADERDLRRAAAARGSQRTRSARFTAWFPPRLDPLWIEARLRASLVALAAELPELRARPPRLEPFRPPSYARSWRKHFPPIRVGKRLLIAPSWSTPAEIARARDGTRRRGTRGGPPARRRDAAAPRIVLRVDPGQAFGTGHHATTRGCLVALERACTAGPPPRGLDVGSGSGVLAIAMRALGVAEVVAVDNDPLAREATAAGARANGYPDVRVLESLARVRGRFDLVTANLFAGLLVAMARPLATRLRPGGTLVVSGLLDTQEVDVGRALRGAGLDLVRRESRSTWATLTWRRPETGTRRVPAGRKHATPAPAKGRSGRTASPGARARRGR